MAFVKYRTRSRSRVGDDFTSGKRLQLDTGLNFMRDCYGKNPSADTLKQMKNDWRRHRVELMADEIRDHPGTRPHAWWLFESIEPRRLVSGVCRPVDDSLFEGTPALYNFDAKTRPEWETQADYLERLGLLTPAEKDYFREDSPKKDRKLVAFKKKKVKTQRTERTER